MSIPVTINDDIERGKSIQYSHRNFTGSIELSYSDKNLIIPLNSLINKYKEYFDDYIINCPLTYNEMNEYRYSPKKLSYNLYGSVEFWSILLYINECHSILDFTPESYVKIIDPNSIREILNEIMILEDIV